MKRDKGTLFLMGILLIGFFTLFSYGAYLDQASEQSILFGNVKEYLIRFAKDTHPLVQELTEQGVVEISVNNDRDHGMAVYYPAFIVWYINKQSPCVGNIFWHTYTFLLVFWGMCSLFFLCRELFHNGRISAFVVLLLFLTPRMFAESHYNNKDVVLLSLTFTMFYWGKRMMRDKSVTSLCMLAFTGALAANLKIVGIWIFGAVGLYLLFYFIVTRQFNRKLSGKAIGCIVLWIGLFILLTPACWPDMIDFFRYFFSNAVDYVRWHDYVLFDGRMLHKDYTGMPRKYLPVLMALTIPMGIILLSIAGGVAAVADFIREKGRCLEDTGYVILMMVVGGVPMAYAILMATPLYNGWRHFYFVYAAVIMGAGYGTFRLRQMAALRGKEIYVKAVAVGYLILLAGGIALNYPQEHSFYNVLAGQNVEERYELDYWDMSIKQAYESILDYEESGEAVVGALNLPTQWGLNRNLEILPKSRREKITIAEEWRDARYVIINTTYAYMYTREEYIWIKENYKLIDSICSYGNVICEVYGKGEDN